jgi:hypothetical protein
MTKTIQLISPVDGRVYLERPALTPDAARAARLHELDGHEPAELPVAGEHDLAHAATADLLQHLVLAQGIAELLRHLRTSPK